MVGRTPHGEPGVYRRTKLREKGLEVHLGFVNCHVGYILTRFVYPFASMTTANTIRVLLAEDHALVGDELCRYLQQFPNVDLVGRAQDGAEAVLKAAKLQPSVVVMDVNLPKMDGIAATREIKMKYPKIVVVGVTSMAEDYIVYAMLKAGAFEVLAKEKALTDLYSTIQRAVASTHPILILEEDQITPNTTPLVSQSDTVSSDVLHTPAEPGETNSDSHF